jgi:hypothetical protein
MQHMYQWISAPFNPLLGGPQATPEAQIAQTQPKDTVSYQTTTE